MFASSRRVRGNSTKGIRVGRSVRSVLHLTLG